MRLMWRFARWSRSMPVLVVFNATLVALAVCIGWHVSSVRNGQFEVRPESPAHDTAGDVQRHALHILGGNLRVVATLLAGACTLGLLTLLNLLWNAFGLGFGLSTLARGTPAAIPLALRYVPLEFSAFVLAASAAEHLSFMVLRCLAAGESPRFRPATIALVMAAGMLVAAAMIEADVARLVADLTAM